MAALLAAGPLCAVEVVLSGRVLDENNAPVGGARVSVTSTAGPRTILRAVADLKGGFILRLPACGRYLVEVDQEGFFRLENSPIEVAESTDELTLVLNHAREATVSSTTPTACGCLPARSTSTR